jgi:hypothetical protein
MSINIYPQASGSFAEDLRKGYLFELYIRKLFNERNFKVLDHRNSLATGDKQLPASYFSLPDLELLFIRNNTYRLAVECKWRQKSFQLTPKEQEKIRKYKKYQREENITVFIAIGIGGEPSNPEKLFVTPLDYISNFSQIEEGDLIEFKRKPTRSFFYDTVQMKLF